ncbi:MAG: Lon protease family protein [Myxococcaceae bacterium]
MSPIQPLPASALYTRCAPASFHFKTSAEVAGLDGLSGQDNAMEALRFGLAVRREGYNLYALGSEGLGKHWTILKELEQRAASEPVPPDWCYVHNFEHPHRPHALRLPPGRGAAFRDEVDSFIERLRAILPAAFESDEYRARMQALAREHEERRDAAFAEFKKRAEEHDVTLLRTPAGLALAPIRAGEVLAPDDFRKLPEEEQARISAEMERRGEELRKVVEMLPAWEHEHLQKITEWNRTVAQVSVSRLVGEVSGRWMDQPAVLAHLGLLQKDVVENVHEWVGAKEGAAEAPLAAALRHLFTIAQPFERYQVNLLVDHAGAQGAPVVYEDRPVFNRLIGRIEHRAHFGALVTDHSLIKKGALHRANGGYLVLDARKLLMQPFAYEELKRCLLSKEIRIESLGEVLSLVSTVSLEPEAIPLSLKVVLIGERPLYYLLAALDPEFLELFKVAVDFEDDVERNTESHQAFARVLASVCRQEDLSPMDPEATARVIEHAARLAEDAERLSTRLRVLSDLMREADHFTRAEGRAVMTGADVQKALDAKVRRSDRMRRRIYDGIRRRSLLIDTRGAEVGQLNGLSIVQMGDFSFAYPVRITARIRMGKGEVVDIEREAELGGPLHSKGVMILAGYLGARYAREVPLALSASLVFEQSYDPVEGDSASAAELLTLISALAEVPLKQGLAVTGSVNQRGRIQPIGGVNEKVEGFFDVCKAGGLTGAEGVLIPEGNVKNLMLRRDVREAAEAGMFRVYSIASIDEAIELLTGLPAGERGELGFPEGTVNRRAEARLVELAHLAKAFAQPARP